MIIIIITALLAAVCLILFYLYRDVNKKYADASEGYRYKQIFYGSSSIMLLIDPETGNIIDANAAACRFYGYSHKDMLEMNMSQINMLSHEGLLNKTRELLKGQQNFIIEHKLSDNSIREVEVFSGPVRIDDKTYIFSVIHDITSRKT